MNLTATLKNRIERTDAYAALKARYLREMEPLQNYHLYSKNPDRLFESMAQTGLPIAQFKLGLPFGLNKPCFVFNDGALFKAVMSDPKTKDNYIAATGGLKAFSYLIGNTGVLMQTGPRHKYMREIMGFNQEELNSSIKIMFEEAKRSVIGLSFVQNSEIDLVEVAYHYTMRVLGRSVLGVEDMEPYIEPTRRAIERGLSTAFPKTQGPLPWTLLLNPVFLYDTITLKLVIESVISDRMKDNRWQYEKDLTSKLLHLHYTDQLLTYEEVVDNLKTMLIAGHETTASSLIWFFYVMDSYRKSHSDDVYDFIYQEASPLSDSLLTTKDKSKLERTFSVLEETMRLYPTAPRTARIAVVDHTIGGVFIPAGSVVFFSNRDRQRKKLTWGTPEEFQKDRFMRPATDQHPDQKWDHAPFGGGNRKCLGDMFARWEMAAFIKEFVGKGFVIELPAQNIEFRSEFTSKIRRLRGIVRKRST